MALHCTLLVASLEGHSTHGLLELGTGNARVVSSHLSHITELSYIIPSPCRRVLTDDGTRSSPFAFLTEPAPNLRKLVLLEAWDGSWPGVAEQFDLLAGKAPRLREVELGICPIPWSSQIFQNLMSLEITLPDCLSRKLFVFTRPQPNQWSTLAPSLEQVMTILDNCSPTLETCRLDFGTLPLLGSAEGYSQTPVCLARLTSFSVRAMVTEFVAFFRCIEVPPRVQLSARLWSPYNDDGRNAPYFELIEIMQQHAARRLTSTAPFTYMSIDNVSYVNVTLSSPDVANALIVSI
ncbi:hypothetical protein EVG20_g8820 [Dentipellis fragilis]|uniref:F-box domain-containing protein n=1 Tax=Dentipellis fragilis TaxID=205917 RepID=A0A4Y9Y3E5_9AGAM|nr:hypothetical protein EVG20_g8820 [Dentipellis fragilis]